MGNAYATLTQRRLKRKHSNVITGDLLQQIFVFKEQQIFSHLPNIHCQRDDTSFPFSNIYVRCGIFTFVCFGQRNTPMHDSIWKQTTSGCYFRKLSVFIEIYTTSSPKQNKLAKFFISKNKLIVTFVIGLSVGKEKLSEKILIFHH